MKKDLIMIADETIKSTNRVAKNVNLERKGKAQRRNEEISTHDVSQSL